MWSKHWNITAAFFVSGQSVTADRYTEYVFCCPLPHTPTPENYLTITATDAPSDSVRITANKVGSTRRGIITWTDGTFNQGSGKQDVITYAQSVSDPVQAFLNLKVSYGSAKIVKTSEDGKVDIRSLLPRSATR